jgi:hypothetical protein
MESQCGFNFHFLYDQRCWTFFQVFIDHLYCFFFYNCLFNSLMHLLIWLFIVLVLNFLSSLYILNINHLSIK